MTDDWQVVEEALQGGTKEPYLEVRRAKAWDALRSLARLREREAQQRAQNEKVILKRGKEIDRQLRRAEAAEAEVERLRAELMKARDE